MSGGRQESQAEDYSEALAAIEAMGATPEQLEEARQALAERAEQDRQLAAPSILEVWPDNAAAVAAFQRLESQWIVHVRPHGGPLWQGLRYEALYPLLDRLQVPQDEQLQVIDQVRVLEATARKVLNHG